MLTQVKPEVDAKLVEYFQKRPERLYSMTPRQFEELVATGATGATGGLCTRAVFTLAGKPPVAPGATELPGLAGGCQLQPACLER